jgi:hypothetical protein
MIEYEYIMENLRDIYNINADIVRENGKYYIKVNGHYAYTGNNINSCLKVLKAIYITVSNINQ